MAYQNYFAAKLATDIGASDTSITLDTAPTITEGRMAIEARNASNREIIKFTGRSGATLTGVLRGQGGTTAKGHLKNALVENNVTAEDIQDIYDAYDGFVASNADGWVPLLHNFTYDSVSNYNQATYTVAGTDVTNILSEGMKVKLPRVTAVGTQCADFDVASSQYASRASASVSGFSFTDDFTVGAWVKIESLGGTNEERTVISRYNGGSTQGFMLRVEDVDGFGALIANFANGTTSRVFTSRANVPLNEWVHVAFRVNLGSDSLSFFVNGKVTGDITTGTAISSIINSGDLNIGAWNSTSDFMDGKVKHAFVSNVIMTEEEILEAVVSDDLTTTAFSGSLVAYYKLEGDFTDSSGNGNDLTANGGVVATDTDSPFSATEYGLVTSASFSTDTTVNVDFSKGLPVNENVTTPIYSTHEVPYGIPTNVARDPVASVAFYAVAEQTIPGGTVTDVTDYTYVQSVGGAFNDATGVFVVPVTGWYHIDASYGVSNITSTTDGRVIVKLVLNSTDEINESMAVGKTTSQDPIATLSVTRRFVAGDALSISATNLTGSSEATYRTFFSGFLVGRT